MTRADEPGLALVQVMATMARGPRRDAAFALWLVVRVAEDILAVPALPERGQRRRVAALEKRLSSLSLPPAFRRALTGAVVQLRELRPEAAAGALVQLAAPVTDTLGSEAAGVVLRVARAAAARVVGGGRGAVS
jgi:hypothetical protein